MMSLKEVVLKGEGRFCLSILLVAIFSLVVSGNAFAGTVELPKTGQTTKYADGDDGDLRKGVAWPNPRFTDNGDGTVTDNLTGLIWLKDAYCTDTVGGVDKSGVILTWADALTWSNNLADGSCGLSDGSTAGQWRLPNVNELESLVNAGQPNSATWLNTQGFSNVRPDRYWSSTSDNTEYAWYVDMWYGYLFTDYKPLHRYVWPVRSGQGEGTVELPKTGQTTKYEDGDDGDLKKGVSWPSPRFTDNGDGTVTDNLTGLTWLKDTNCTNTVGGVDKSEGRLSWSDAVTWANNLADGSCGLSDGSTAGQWRLPNKKELRSLIDYSMTPPALPNGNPFSNMQADWYWSSTTHAGDTGYAWILSGGAVDSSPKDSSLQRVWPVRSTCTPPPSGMVSWWKAENNANDSVGTNHGTMVNGAAYARGKVGQAFSFGTGLYSYVEMADSNIGDFGADPFTVDFWMYSNDDGNGSYIMGKSNPDGGLGWDIRLNYQKIRLEGTDGWAPMYNWESNNSVSPNSWHHVAISATSDSIAIYIDGVLDGTTSRSTISSTSNPFRIGFTTNYGGTAFSGLIDEVEIFNRALTAEEIAAIYNAESVGKCDLQYTLTVTKSGTGSGVITSDPTGIECGSHCTENYPSGTTVTLTAASGPGSVFSAWAEDCSNCGSNAECAINVDGDKTCTATFTAQPPDTYTLTVTRAGLGLGTVSSVPGGINCGVDCMEWFPKGSKVFLTASPENGSIFAGWSGDCVGRKATKKVVMKSDKSCTANFALGPDLVVRVVSVSPEPVQAGEKVIVTYQVTNQGDYTTGKAGKVSFVLSSDFMIEHTDTLLGSQRIPKLSPGASVTKTKAVRIGTSVPVGGYFLGLIVDPLNTISETDESNNTAHAPLTVE